MPRHVGYVGYLANSSISREISHHYGSPQSIFSELPASTGSEVEWTCPTRRHPQRAEGPPSLACSTIRNFIFLSLSRPAMATVGSYGLTVRGSRSQR